MSNAFVYLNDRLVRADKASLRINDLSIQRGYGIFDFFKTVNGHPVFLDDHLDRFYSSAAYMRLPVEQNREEMKTLLSDLIQKNNMPDSGVRITLTGGYSTDCYNLAKPNLIIAQQALSINKEIAQSGIRLVTYPHQRQFSQAKTIDYLTAIWLQPFILENKADEVLYQQNGLVSECPRANFFIVTADDKVVTPGNNILKGVIRKQVLQLAATRFITEERDITLEDVQNAREAFITSTTRNILPVVQVNNYRINNEQPGKISNWLSRELGDVIHRQVN